MQCKECNYLLEGRQTVFCSSFCAGRFHRRAYRERHPDRVKEEKREYAKNRRSKKLPKNVWDQLAQQRIQKKLTESETTPRRPIVPAVPMGMQTSNRQCAWCEKFLMNKQNRYCSLACYGAQVQETRNSKKVDLRIPVKWSQERRRLSEQSRKEARDIGLNLCARCGENEEIEVNHIRPLEYNGNSEQRNLMVLCRTCHDLWHLCMDNKRFWSGT